MTYRVFLSYSVKDERSVTLVAEQARNIGIDAFTAAHDTQAGRRVDEKVLEAIKHCHALVVLLTSEGYDSAFVQQEVGAARMANKPVIPVVAPQVKDRSLGLLTGIEYVELDPQSPETGIGELTRSIGRLAAAKATADFQLAVVLGAVVLLFLVAKGAEG